MEEPLKNTDRNLKNKKVLILGLGFIGISLLKKLMRDGAVVSIFSKKIDPKLQDNLGSEVEFVEGDIRDREEINKIVKDKDIILDMAGRSGQVASLKEPILDLEVNLMGQLNLLEAIKEFNPDARIVFPGSRLEYGKPMYLPVDERHPLNPLSLYGIHKLTAGKYHLEYHKIFGLKTTVLRIANPYGPHPKHGEVDYNIVNYFIDQAESGHDIKIYGDGLQLRDYIYIEDLADIILEVALNNNAIGEDFNVGTGKGTYFLDMAKTVANLFGVKVEKVPWPDESKKVETGNYITDISKLTKLMKSELDFKDIEAGLKLTKKLMFENTSSFWSETS